MVESPVSLSNMGEIILHGPHQLNPRYCQIRQHRAYSHKLGIKVYEDDFIACVPIQRNIVKDLEQKIGTLLLCGPLALPTFWLAFKYCSRHRRDEWNARKAHGFALPERAARR